MKELEAAHTASMGDKTNKQQIHSTPTDQKIKASIVPVYSTESNQQRERILAWLKTAPLTTLQARKELDVLHPAARVMELRTRGHNIATHWTVVDTGKAKHRIASYILLVGVWHE